MTSLPAIDGLAAEYGANFSARIAMKLALGT
jgi:hypothetical protein